MNRSRAQFVLLLVGGVAASIVACGDEAQIPGPPAGADDAGGGSATGEADGSDVADAAPSSTDAADASDASDAADVADASDASDATDASEGGPDAADGSAGGTVRRMSAGNAHTCVIRDGGTVRCWGHNDRGQLGAAVGATSATPVDVAGLSGVVELAAAVEHTCARLANGTVRCWGEGSSGQLGDGLKTDSVTPVEVSGLTDAVAISSHWSHTCALRANEEVVCWGYNGGRIGDNTKVTRETPTAPVGITQAIAVATGWGHTCVLRTGGTGKCWGTYNVWGQVGDGSTAERIAPVDVQVLTGAIAIEAGSYHTCALLGTGTVKCWGNAQIGSIGTGAQDSDPHATPVDVPNLTGVAQIALGGSSSCAITTAGKVHCWGNHIGHPTTATSSTPVEITSLAGAVEITGGGEHQCARFASGEVKCWGNNSLDQLGDGTKDTSLAPITVQGL